MDELLTFDGDFHLSTDGRWDSIRCDALEDVIAVARDILDDDHFSSYVDPFKQHGRQSQQTADVILMSNISLT